MRPTSSPLLLAVALCALPLIARGEQAGPESALAALRGDVAVWLQARSLAALTDGAPVGQWPDARRGSPTAIQPIAERRPTLVANATNGLPAVRFDADARQTLMVPDLSLAADSTQFYVFSPRGFGRDAPFFEHGPNVNDAPGSLLYGDLPMFTMRRAEVLASVAGQADWVYLGPGHNDLDLMFGFKGVWVVVSVVHRTADGSDPIVVRRNGTRQNQPYGSETRIVDDVVVDSFHIGSRDGGAYWSSMDLGELILVNGSMDDSEIRAIERDLAHKWGIDLND